MIWVLWILSPSTLGTLIMAHTFLSNRTSCVPDSQVLLQAFFKRSSSVWNTHLQLNGLSFNNSPRQTYPSSG